jgi:high affinity sulfate transporter 1
MATKDDHHFPLMEGLLPIDKPRIPTDVIAGCTLAALAIPEVMGYSNIAGMPVVTGLYTLVLPMLAFAFLGSSRHLVVGADSATAAVMAAGLAGLAATGSSEYIALAGLMAIMAGCLLILARLAKLGFIADFLSRTVLIGFLTGVGVQVAMGQLGGMLGVHPSGDTTLSKFWNTLKLIPDTSVTTLCVALGVLLTIVGLRAINKRIPGALLAVVGSIVISKAADLGSHGVATLGKVEGGLPSIGFPADFSWSEVGLLVPTALSIFVIILAQSAATSRAYAARYNETFSENVDLIGLGVGSIAAGLSGTYVVNGSPTKTQMVDSAGGRSQFAQLTTAVLVIFVLLFLTGPLQYMPEAVLAAVVFLIGVELIDIGGMAKVFRLRRDEFVVALLTAITVVVVGVEQGIILAIVMSIIDHVRRSYHPLTAVVVPGDEAEPRWHGVRVTPDTRTEPGLVVYRFSAGLYYANSNAFAEQALGFLTDDGGSPVRWLVIDAVAINDVDFTAGEVLRQLHGECQERGIRLAFADVLPEVREELDRYGITELVGPGAFYGTVADAVAAYGSAPTPAD